jgi:hypothetical protein
MGSTIAIILLINWIVGYCIVLYLHTRKEDYTVADIPWSLVAGLLGLILIALLLIDAFPRVTKECKWKGRILINSRCRNHGKDNL